MQATLPDSGVLSYGGITFDALYKTNLSGRAQWDRAHRVIKYTTWTLSVEGFLTNPNTSQPMIDGQMQFLRQQLAQPGLTLKYLLKGFGGPGGLVVNAQGGGGIQDVCWGPKPQVLDFKPLGGGLAALVSWKLEFSITEMPNAKFLNQLLAFNWNTELSFNEDGYANYSINGELEIAMTYQPGQTTGMCANGPSLTNFQNLTEPPVPIGFRPTHRRRSQSDDRRTMDWSYAYEEIPPAGLPVNCTNATGRYSVKSSGGKNILAGMWEANLSATYTIRPDAPRREAWFRFAGLLISRLNASVRGELPRAGRPNAVPLARTGGPRTAYDVGAYEVFRSPILAPLPLDQFFGAAVTLQPRPNVATSSRAILKSMGFSEGLYLDSKTVSFEASWTLMTSLDTLLVASGLWRKIGDSRPSLWKASMQDVICQSNWGDYGFLTRFDFVVNASYLQGQVPNRIAAQNAALPLTMGQNLAGTYFDPDTGASPDAAINMPGAPPPEGSWINYQNKIEVDLEPGFALQKLLPQANTAIDTLAAVDAYGTNPDGAQGSVNLASNCKQADYCQRVATPTFKATMRGFAVRVGYTIPVPGLLSFGGVGVVAGRQRASCPEIVANYGGMPVYLQMWDLQYMVPVPPVQAQQAPRNLAEHIDGTALPLTTIPIPVSVPEINVPLTKTEQLSQQVG